jgi:meiotically up-regulated gene 157 (Mug157) protein
MSFAFSAANPGFVPGPRGGLGSAHTPGPWALGDVQGWIRSLVTADAAGAAAARARLAEAAFDDGMLPEAYATDGGERVRAWFAWPGATYAALTALERAGRLATIAA